jgi:UV DNA damage endonuclease
MPPYRFGFAVKVLGEGGLRSSDTRRWQSQPHLSRSLELLDAVFDYLDRHDLRVYRLSSNTIPYGTHPELPQFDYRRQIEECAAQLAALAEKAAAYGLRLSTHPGQYAVVNAPDAEVRRKALLDIEQDALLLEALGQGNEAAVVVHVGGAYGEKQAALDRWARAYDDLTERARRYLAVENDETSFDIADVLGLHRRTGTRVVFDHHHHRCNPSPELPDVAGALAAAYATWPAGARPKAHISSPRTELRSVGRGRKLRLLPPLLDQHADFVHPWDVADLLRLSPGPLDLMVEAKAKDLAVFWLRRQLERLDPDLAAAEERQEMRSRARRRAQA